MRPELLLPRVSLSCVLALLAPGVAMADTAFTYQGELKENGEPAVGAIDIEFSLWDAPDGGARIGCAVPVNNVQVVDGRFSAQLDFGADAFDNSGRWLELTVEGFTLTPRQPVTRSPYSIQTRGIFVDQNYNVGIGTDTPEEKMHIVGDDATLRIETDGPTNDGTFLRDTADGTSRLWKQVAVGEARLDFDAIPTTGFSPASIRFFRHTSTSGGKQVEFYDGLGTDNVSARIGTSGADSWFQLLSGDFGIGTDNPAARLDVVGRGNAPVIRAEIEDSGPGLRVGQGADTLDVKVNSINTRGDSPITDPLYLNDEVSAPVLIGVGGGNLGVGGATSAFPLVKLHVDGGFEATVDDLTSGHVLLGSPVGANLVMDGNEIMARNAGAASTLFVNNEGGEVVFGGGIDVGAINADGGDVTFGGAIDIGYEIVESAECLDAGNGTRAVVYCPAGKSVIGGGCWSGSAVDDLTQTMPVGTTGWECHKDANCDPPIRAYAICARVN